MFKFMVRDSADYNMILGVIQTDGCAEMLYEAKEKAIAKFDDDYTIDDIVVEARKMFPDFSFIYDHNVSSIIL